jgi:YesN/AraC family two-component response regulator
MEELYDDEQGSTSIPHRHHYYTIIWATKTVKGKHLIDFSQYPIKKDTIFFILPGQIHQLSAENRPAGYVITFGSEFLNRAKIEKSFIDNLKVFNSFLYNEPLPISNEKALKLKDFILGISENINNHSQFRHEILGSYLKLFLMECTSVCDAEIEIDENKSKMILDEFKKMVEKHFRKIHRVQYYADQLVISPGHLNRTIKDQLGITAKNYIKERIVLETKRLLLFSGLSLKEIGFELGFGDPHHFSKFIKSSTGFSATQFIKKYKVNG